MTVPASPTRVLDATREQIVNHAHLWAATQRNRVDRAASLLTELERADLLAGIADIETATVDRFTPCP